MDLSFSSQELSSEPSNSSDETLELAAGASSTPRSTLSLNLTSNSSSRSGKKRSLAWVHYTTTTSDDKTAQCNLCGEKVKTSGNTTNLMIHLKKYHESEHAAIMQQQEKVTQNPSKKRCTELAKGQLTLSGSIERTAGYPKNSFKRALIDKALVKMITTDLQPASFVEDTGFNEFLRVIDPKYTPPSRRTIMRDHLSQLYSSKCDELRKELEGVQHCSITTDCWTSRATEGYIIVTCHYIRNNWELRSMVLNTTRLTTSHTSENLALALKEITDRWGITEKVHCCISDSANNIKRAIRLNQWSHLSCLAHTINLIVATSISHDQELVTLVGSVKKIVSFFHHSSKAMDSLHLNQKRLNLPEHKLIQQVDTRWNSTYYMLERYLEQYEAIKTTLCLLDRNDLMIPRERNTALQEVVKILTPFESVTREISSENYTSGSKIIPISRCLQRLVSTSVTSHSLAESLVTEMRARFLGMEENNLLTVSTLLDPRFKKLAFSDKDAAERGVRILLSEASIDVPAGNSRVNEPSVSIQSAEPQPNDLWKVFDEEVAQ
uniref:BED-type domain-containing protein n=1 Tax=Amphimedon queenslandica TaxID=400682 RepID=A0A1X7UJA9_AMPQE